MRILMIVEILWLLQLVVKLILCFPPYLQCVSPFVGDGLLCTVDTDGDSYPDIALTNSALCNNSESQIPSFCRQVRYVHCICERISMTVMYYNKSLSTVRLTAEVD